MLFVGIDIGTSAVRATAIDAAAQPLADSRVSLPAAPADALVEPDSWWLAVVDCLQQLKQKIDTVSVAAISIDGTSSTTLLVDADNRPVGPALLYNDSRAGSRLEALADRIPINNITRSATSSLLKADWLLSQPGAHNARYILHQADWISARLSGKAGVADENNCLKLGYDSVQQCWPDWMQSLPTIAPRLPRVVAPGTDLGPLSAGLAMQLGMLPGTRIISGTTDSTASTLATGISDIGQGVTTLGTTMVMKILSPHPVTSLADGVYSHRLADGKWLVGGASNSGGGVLLDYFTPAQLEALSSEMDTAVDTGLDYYPLSVPGERFPINDPAYPPRLLPRPASDMRFLQGMFEGFARIEQLAYQRLGELGAPEVKQVITAGGRAADNLSLQAIRARIINKPVSRAVHTEASYGSALLARQGWLSWSQT